MTRRSLAELGDTDNPVPLPLAEKLNEQSEEETLSVSAFNSSI